MKAEELTLAQLRTIFVSIHLGVGGHGGFLTTIATAVVLADNFNISLMEPLLRALVDKYDLATPAYLDIPKVF